MFLVGVHPIRDIRQSQSQDAESQLNAKSQEVGTLSAKAEAKTGKQQALLPGAAGMVLCGQNIAKKTGKSLIWSWYLKDLEFQVLMLHSWLVSVLLT